MDIIELMKERHSVRQYKNKAIEEEKRKVLKSLVDKYNKESGLNIQIIYDDPKCFNSIVSRVSKFKNCQNYIVLVGNNDDELLEEKCGYYGEAIVLKAQELGLNTCWVGITHGKSLANIKKDEKQVILIALGYGENKGLPHKSKELKEVSNVYENLPDWYVLGIEAALLAPTAINQQKFYFTLNNDEVSVEALKGPYAKVDLGIIKYHFEIASNHKIK